MGRYTTVQTYTDQDAKVAAIAYSSATGAPDATSAENAADLGPLQVKREQGEGEHFHLNRVENVSGSSAGAGSGEFHMYRAARRRELDRVTKMEADYAKKKAQEEFEDTRKRKLDDFESRTIKRAEKRRRRKDRAKARSLDGHLSGGDDAEHAPDAETDGGSKDGGKADKTKASEEAETVEIPNDGLFLERMLELQRKQEQENKSETK